MTGRRRTAWRGMGFVSPAHRAGSLSAFPWKLGCVCVYEMRCTLTQCLYNSNPSSASHCVENEVKKIETQRMLDEVSGQQKNKTEKKKKKSVNEKRSQ